MKKSEVNYTLQVNNENLSDRHSQREVTRLAKLYALDSDNEVYVRWFRYQDYQSGFLNSDGDHEITGYRW